MKKLLVLGGAFVFLVFMSGCEVTPGYGYGGAYGEFYGEYPNTYYGDYYDPGYPYYGYGYGYRYHHGVPFDRDHYRDRGHAWGGHVRGGSGFHQGTHFSEHGGRQHH